MHSARMDGKSVRNSCTMDGDYTNYFYVHMLIKSTILNHHFRLHPNH